MSDQPSAEQFASIVEDNTDHDKVSVVDPEFLRYTINDRYYREILQELMEEDGMPISKLAVALNKRPGRVRDRVEKLEDGGVVSVVGDGEDPVVHLAVDAVVSAPIPIETVQEE